MPDPAETAVLPLDAYRDYLLLLARLHLGRDVPGRLEPSDLVQQTLLDAHQQWDQFRGRTGAELAAWLRRMLACNLIDARRALGRAKRDAGREQSLHTALEQSSARIADWLAVDQTSASGQAVRHEEAVRLAAALAQLPDAQRDALVLRHLEGWTLADISRHLDRTPSAVAGLLKRGLKQLRELLAELEG
jgi:RNA polymerase sigma-70 factor (ECF subfamily)